MKIQTSIQYDHEQLKQVNMVVRENEIEKKIGYKLDQTSLIIMHAHDDVFFHLWEP